MALLRARQGHSFSMIHQESRTGWNLCMSKAYCKWPAIAGIVVAIVVILLGLFCCYRCCCRRRSKGPKKSAQSFLPAPLQGYMPANNNTAPPPPQYAQFDTHTGYRGATDGKVTEDSLPHMPSWQDARQTRIMEDHNAAHPPAGGDYKGENHEMGNLQKPATASTNYLPPHQQQQQQPPYHNYDQHQQSGVTEMDSYGGAQQQAQHRAPSPYTGPDFGAPPAQSPGGHAPYQQQQYTGPDFSTPSHTGYSAYTPSESTKYEPTTYELASTTSNPQSGAHPGALQSGKPGQFREV